MSDEMCPNCVTPWKCNGPHLGTDGMTDAERAGYAADFERGVGSRHKHVSLTDFLLARIAEDEAEAHKWEAREVRWPARKVLAECEAKRQIVELHGDPYRHPESFRHLMAVETFQFLALPYADHPDYREEWKP